MTSGRFKAKHFIVGGTGFLITIILVTTFTSLYFLKMREIDTWKNQLSSLSLVLAEQTTQSMAIAQLTLDSIVERVNSLGLRSVKDLRSKARTIEIHQFLRDKIASLSQVDVATIVAANGDVINFTRSYPVPVINLSDRDYFQERLHKSSNEIFISTPVKNRGNGKWVFYLSHRLNDKNGDFIGLILIGISVDQFTNFYQRVGENLGLGATVTLFRDDYTFLTRWPIKDDLIGRKNPVGISQLVVDKMQKSNDVIYSDEPRTSEGGLHVPRLAAIRVLNQFPLIINLTITDEFFLASWRRTANTVSSFVTGSILALLMTAYFLLRVTRQQEKSTELILETAEKLKSLNHELSEESEKNLALLHGASDGIHILDFEGNIIEASDSFCTMLGYRREEVIGMNVSQWDAGFADNKELMAIVRRQFESSERIQFETRHRRKDGAVIDVEISGFALILKGKPVLFNSSRDISERKQLEEKIRQLAYYDTLTNLPNRRLLEDRLIQTMATSKRTGKFCALMFLDLDNFKPLNDLWGHALGDLLLIDVAERIKASVREADTVARFGGDEFVVILNELDSNKTKSSNMAFIVADKIRLGIAKPFKLTYKVEGKADVMVEHQCTASIGLTIFMGHEETMNKILKYADTAMYRAKDAGRNSIRISAID